MPSRRHDQAGNAWASAYRVLLEPNWRGEGPPVCVVAGPNRRRAWLYVHKADSDRPAARFLLDVLRELTEPMAVITAVLVAVQEQL